MTSSFYHVILLLGVTCEVGSALVKWVYTDAIEVSESGVDFLLSLLKCAGRYKLQTLVIRYVELILTCTDIMSPRM